MLLNTPKALLLGIGLVALAVLIALGAVDGDAGLPVMTAWLGYGVGNGVASRNGVSAPLVAPRWDGTERRGGEG